MSNNSSKPKIGMPVLVIVGALAVLTLLAASVAVALVLTKPPPPPPQPTAAVIANDTPVLVAPLATPTSRSQLQPLPTVRVSHPAGTTGLCFDRTYTFETYKKRACLQHDGVAEWWGP